MNEHPPQTARRFLINGIVQGVGFRPWLHRLAGECRLTGWVLNNKYGVEVLVQGPQAALDAFREKLADPPPLAMITQLVERQAEIEELEGFEIRKSDEEGRASTFISPDTDVCADCVREMFDPEDRRHRYPFINCTNCGPRYSIIQGLPYDRPQTTMSGFPLCEDCAKEYEDPEDRRYHAQPVACPVCGPHVTLEFENNTWEKDEAIGQARQLIAEGRILAVKGIGGYHLVCDAFNEEAVSALRTRKKRDLKPFAVMARDAEIAASFCEISEIERRELESRRRPIILLEQKQDHELAQSVAGGLNTFGVMLPYAPLHHLLLEDPLSVIVATSANYSDEPLVWRDETARALVGELADGLLTHNRPIHAAVDDSIVRVIGDQPTLIRRARGYVPLPVTLDWEFSPILAVGAELKNAFCLTSGPNAFLSTHHGDLKSPETLEFFKSNLRHLKSVFDVKPRAVACDLHPDYLSTRFATETKLPLIKCQHHHAHIAACCAENGVNGPVLGVAFDGLGLGDDKTIWGGELLMVDGPVYRRVGHIQPIPLPGGDKANEEPARMALSLIHTLLPEALPEAIWLKQHFGEEQFQALVSVIEKGVNSPLTSSAGRLFDAFSSIVGLCQKMDFEGQAAMLLEAAFDPENTRAYPFYPQPNGDGWLVIDPADAAREALLDVMMGEPPSSVSSGFHRGLANGVVCACAELSEELGIDRVALSGGCFQNKVFTELVLEGLNGLGLKVYRHKLTPPGDGGVSLGQAWIASQTSAGSLPAD